MSDNITNKVNGDTVDASEWNQFADIDNAITTSGQTPSTLDLFQISKAMANYAAQGSVFGTDSGIVNAYVVTQISPFKAPDALRIGMTIVFRTANTNTGPSTVNAFMLGALAIKKSDGITDVTAGDIPAGRDIKIRYNGSIFILSNDSLADLYNNSLRATNGYERVVVKEGGVFVEIIRQWGTTANINAEGGQIVTLPITFPNAILNSRANVKISTPGVNNDYWAQTYSPTVSSLGVFLQISAGGGTSFPVNIEWEAIGY